MGRSPCCSKVGLRRGPWSNKENALLINYIQQHGEGQWRDLPKKAGLLRCGKSCRLRWLNYLKPGIKRGNIGEDEEDLILRLHKLLGNRWSLIAGRLPGRTDNEIKNYWNTHLVKKLNQAGNEKDLSKKSTMYGAGTAVEIKEKRRGEIASATADEKELSDVPEKIEDPPKIRVYKPRAIRIPPEFGRSVSYDSLISRTSSGDAFEPVTDKLYLATPELDLSPLFDLEDLPYEEHVIPVNQNSGGSNMFDIVYNEFRQLV